MKMSLTAHVVIVCIAIAGMAVAQADDFSGTYGFRPQLEGEGFSAVWTVTQCGDGCVHITSSTGGTDTDAHREGRYWIFDRVVDPGIECPPTPYSFKRQKLPATMRFTINADTLMGQFQPLGTPCGAVPLPSSFQLLKLEG